MALLPFTIEVNRKIALLDFTIEVNRKIALLDFTIEPNRSKALPYSVGRFPPRALDAGREQCSVFRSPSCIWKMQIGICRIRNALKQGIKTQAHADLSEGRAAGPLDGTAFSRQ